MELHTIRRFGVDIYRYRKEALALRAQTRTEFFRIAGRVFRPVILAVIAAYLSVIAAYLSMRVIAPSAAEVPETIAARGETLVATDIPLLRLDVAARHGSGLLSEVTTIQLLNTHGGRADAACDAPGTFLSVLYSADYASPRPSRLAFLAHPSTPRVA